jgi:hypothetical protein
VGGAILVRAFELQYDIAGAVEFERFIGNGGVVAEISFQSSNA